MNNKDIQIVFASALAASAISSCSCDSDDRQHMNVIYIMCDDHSYQTISAYNRTLMHTPNIDRLSDEGYRFTNSFVANSLSGPSRACLLTGKHSHMNGFTNNEHGVFDNTQMTFPKLLQKNGYETAVVGKWHLVTEPSGFTHWDILDGQGEYYQPVFICNGDTLLRQGYVTEVITEQAIDWMKNKRDKKKPFCLMIHHKAPHRSWMPDTQDLGSYDHVDFPLPETFDDNYQGRTAALLQEMSIADDMNPAYDLKMADKDGKLVEPRWRWTLGMYRGGTEEGDELKAGRMDHVQQKAWNEYYDPIIERFRQDRLEGKDLAVWKYQRYLKDYCSVINSVDRNVGKIYEYLKNEGLLENTMIIYTSDQGFFMGEHGFFDKRFMYEESFRTPLVIRLPDKLGRKRPAKSSKLVYGPDFGKGSHDISEFVQNIDLAPTILEYAGVSIPEEIQGESFLGLMTGTPAEKMKTDTGEGWRDALYYHYYEYPAEHAVRRHYGIRTERYSLMHFYNDIDCWELYDLKKDPLQIRNIYGTPEAEDILPELMEKLHKLQKQYEDPI